MAFAPDGFFANEEEYPLESLLPNASPLPPVEDTLAVAEPVPKAPPIATPLFGIDGALVGELVGPPVGAGLVGPPVGAEVGRLVDPSPISYNFM
jgi:hypothetical protein